MWLSGLDWLPAMPGGLDRLPTVLVLATYCLEVGLILGIGVFAWA